MKKLIISLAAFSLIASPAMAMSSTENVPASNQPVSAEDQATFKKDHNDVIECQFAKGTFTAFSHDSRYNTLTRHYNAAMMAARPDRNNRPKFLEYRSLYSDVREGRKDADGNWLIVGMSATHGCAAPLTPLSTERR